MTSWSIVIPCFTFRSMDENYRRQIGAKIRTARKLAGLSQEELAEKVDKTPETISNIERGHVTVGLDTLHTIGMALKIPMRDFFANEPGSGRRIDPKRAALESRLLTASSHLDVKQLRLLIGIAALMK